jgi:acyl-CoA thioesterase-2
LLDLLALLQLEYLDRDLYRGRSDDVYGALYGGQVAAQALLAAAATAGEDRVPHSLHSYFLRRGDAAAPVILRVDRDRDGRSYSARRVTAVQDGAVIFNLSASFHVPEDGPDEQVPSAPTVGAPEDARPSRLMMAHLSSFEMRLPPQPRADQVLPTRGWFRPTVELPDDPKVHFAALLYLSDTFTGLWRLPIADGHGGLTSLDHAVWFHRPFRFDDWVLMDMEAVSVAGGRGLYLGHFFDRAGRLLATMTQESLFRPGASPIPAWQLEH